MSYSLVPVLLYSQWTEDSKENTLILVELKLSGVFLQMLHGQINKVFTFFFREKESIHPKSKISIIL